MAVQTCQRRPVGGAAAADSGRVHVASDSAVDGGLASDFPTRLPAELTLPYGVTELHAVMFQPRGDAGGAMPAVALQVPECSRQQFRRGLAIARELRARVSIICDTADQADRARRVASRHLPDHRPIALERALAGGWGLAS